MEKLTRSEQILAQRAVCVLLVRGETIEAKRVFAYVAVRADMLQEFLEAQRSGVFYPEEYGIILEAGEGEPSDEIREKMTKEYGFNHDGMLDLPSGEKAAELTQNLTQAAATILKEKPDDSAQ